MFFKVSTSKDDFYFVDGNYIDKIKAGKNEQININKDGYITFFKLDEQWFFETTLPKQVYYKNKKIKCNKTYKFKYHKDIKVDNIIITLIKTLPYKPIIPLKGLKYTSDLAINTVFTIGRKIGNDLVIDNPQIDLFNTRIIHDGNTCYIEDLNSSNGMYINGKKRHSKVLEDGDIISIPGVAFMYSNQRLLWSTPKEGIRVDVANVSKTVIDSWTKKPVNILNDISFTINEGEFVGIIGGSGTGKTTLLDAITARRKSTSGLIYYDLNNYYTFKNSYQKIVGYVPQKDIMHDNLTVYKTLYFYSFIKMKHRLTKAEIDEMIKKVLDDVSLTDQMYLKVSKLSGGQRKRVSIAMELMCNPKILFLDEPTSGLSPDLDYEITELLYKISRSGRTVVVITHNMENVDRFDKIAFLGVGGHLCYYGEPAKVSTFFKSKKFGAIFNMLSSLDNTLTYEKKLRKSLAYKEMIKNYNALFEEDSK